MQNLIPIFFILIIAYFIFFRRGGNMGYCGGFIDPAEARKNGTLNRKYKKTIHNSNEQVIDLGKDEYTVIASENKKLPKQ